MSNLKKKKKEEKKKSKLHLPEALKLTHGHALSHLFSVSLKLKIALKEKKVGYARDYFLAKHSDVPGLWTSYPTVMNKYSTNVYICPA